MKASLTIGIVAYEMEGTPTGVGRYLEGILCGLASNGHRDGSRLDLVLFMKGSAFEHRLWSSDGDSGRVRIRPLFDDRPTARPIVWEQLRLPRLIREQQIDALFSPSYSLPPRLRTPAIVTIHDLSFEHLPDAFPIRERWRRRFLARRAARRAARVLADTETIARELHDAYKLDPAKVEVIPLAVDGRFQPQDRQDDAARILQLGIASPFILVLGTVLERRRLDLVISAFDRLAAQDPAPRLVIAGRNRLREPGRLDAWIEGAAARDRIVRLDWVPESDLPSLYRQACAAVYLSTYEGFGLPPLEALACGTPCVVSAGLGLDDLWPEYPLRVSHLDAPAVAAALEIAIGPRGRPVAEEGSHRMAALDWRRSADRFLEIARDVVAEAAGGDRK